MLNFIITDQRGRDIVSLMCSMCFDDLDSSTLAIRMINKWSEEKDKITVCGFLSRGIDESMLLIHWKSNKRKHNRHNFSFWPDNLFTYSMVANMNTASQGWDSILLHLVLDIIDKLVSVLPFPFLKLFITLVMKEI